MAKLRYLGISFVEIQTDDGKTVYIDPCISINPDCPIKLEDIERADLVLVTHMARDHASDMVPVLERTGARLVCARDTARAARQAGIPDERIKVVVSGVAVEEAGVRVKALKTEHGSWSIQDDHPVFDLSLGYICYARDGVGIYHVGDTSIFSEFELFGKLYKPKVMLVPIGMFPGAITEMDPWEAAVAVSMVAPEIAIPVHYDRKGQRDYPEQLAAHLRELAPNVQVRVLEPGESIEV